MKIGHRKLLIATIAVGLCAFLLVLVARSPIRLVLPVSYLQSLYLVRTPLGSSVDDVTRYVSEDLKPPEWKFYAQPHVQHPSGKPLMAIGSTHTEVLLGTYYLPFRVDVMGVWAFDTNGQLIAIDIRKFVDAP